MAVTWWHDDQLLEQAVRRELDRRPEDPYARLFIEAAVMPDQPDITDAELDAATLAYMDVRYPGGAEAWRKAWPTAWRELRDRMRFALLAAAAVRSN